MKTIKTNYGEATLTDEQFLICSWIATIEKTPNQENGYPSEKKYWQLWGLTTAAMAAGVEWWILSDIQTYKNYKGYINMNKLSDIQYFEN